MGPTRPTIAQIVPQLDTGGAEVTTLEVAEAIVKAGGRALVLSQGGRLAARIAEVGGEVMVFPAATKNPARILWNAQRLKGVIASERIDLLHARSRAPAWSALLAARSLGIPFVTTHHGAYKETGRLKNLYNSVVARADVVIANSQYTAQSIRSRYGKPENGIAIIYRGVDFERFAPERVTAERVAALRERWGIAASQRVVLHAARLTPLKGQSVVIDAARLLKERGCLGNTVFVLAGSDQGRTAYAETLVAQVRSAGLTEHVRLVGHLEDMPGGFGAAQLALMVSTEPEGFGRVAAEAQAMGCPVVVTETGRSSGGRADGIARPRKPHHRVDGEARRSRCPCRSRLLRVGPVGDGTRGDGKKGTRARHRKLFGQGDAAPDTCGVRSAARYVPDHVLCDATAR